MRVKKQNRLMLLRRILTLFLMMFSLVLMAQVDGKEDKKKGKKKAIIAVPIKPLIKPKSLKNDSIDGFKNAFAKKQKLNAKKKQQSDFENKGILSAARIAEEIFLNSYKRINAPYPKIDQDLGSFRTKSGKVRIVCRDFQYPDGDRVSIWINNIPIVSNITLRRAYQGFDIPLEKGINKISFVALNQGSSGPNTAAFKVFDDKGYAISSNEWNLATGAKATILIAKEE